MTNWKKLCKGHKGVIDFGDKKVTFTAGGRRRVLVEACEYDPEIGSIMVNGEVILADGTKAWALLELDESSSGELWGTGVFTPAGLAFQGEDSFFTLLGKDKDQVYPYRYKYHAPVVCHDHHVGDDGWST